MVLLRSEHAWVAEFNTFKFLLLNPSKQGNDSSWASEDSDKLVGVTDMECTYNVHIFFIIRSLFFLRELPFRNPEKTEYENLVEEFQNQWELEEYENLAGN